MAEKQDNNLKMIKMKGYIGYVQHGFKNIAAKYDDIKWGNNPSRAKKIVKTPFKTTYKF